MAFQVVSEGQHVKRTSVKCHTRHCPHGSAATVPCVIQHYHPANPPPYTDDCALSFGSNQSRTGHCARYVKHPYEMHNIRAISWYIQAHEKTQKIPGIMHSLVMLMDIENLLYNGAISMLGGKD